MFKCPKCGQILIMNGKSYQCVSRHTYDISKRGYVNFVAGSHKKHGDEKSMIVSRTRFLESGYYDVLQTFLVAYLKKVAPKCIVDAGCGEGYYTNAIAKKIDGLVYGFDLSKAGIDYACKNGEYVQYAVANIFHLPLFDATADVVLSVFAPIDIKEINRVLEKGGLFIKVGPAARHLYGLKEILYKDVYENIEEHKCYEGFELIDTLHINDQIHIDSQQHIFDLFQMTPYYWKTSKEASERLKCIDALDTEISFLVQIYKKI